MKRLRRTLGVLALLAPCAAAPGEAREGKDLYGDPVPAGAVRLGTSRLREGRVISRIAFSPDGAILASVGSAQELSSEVCLWDAATGRLVRRIECGQGITDFAFLPEARRLLTADSNQFHIWDTATGREIRGFPQVHKEVRRINVSPNGRVLLAMTGAAEGAWVVEIATGKKLFHIARDGLGVFSPDGRTIAISGPPFPITARSIWGTDDVESKAYLDLIDASSGATIRSPKGAGMYPTVPAFSPDGNFVAWRTHSMRTGANLIEVVDVATGKTFRQLSEGPGMTGFGAGGTLGVVGTMAFGPGGKLLAAPGSDTALRLWDVQKGAELRRIGAYGSLVAFSPDGNTLATADMHVIRLSDAATGAGKLPDMPNQGQIAWVSFSPDSRTVATAGEDRAIRLWDAATGRQAATITGHTTNLCSVEFSPDGESLVSAAYDHTVRKWDVASRKETGRMEDANWWPKYAAFLGDGNQVCVAGHPWHFVWDIQGKTQRQWNAGPHGTTSAAVAPLAGLLAIANGDGHSLDLWSIAKGARRLTLTSDGQDSFRQVCFSGTGDVMGHLTGRRIVLLETCSGKAVLELPRPAEMASMESAMAISPDGCMIAAVAPGHRIVLLGAATGKVIGDLAGHRAWVRALAFSPDGNRLVSTCNDTTALVWDVSAFRSAGPSSRRLDSAGAERLWTALCGEDAKKAYQATWELVACGDEAVAMLERRLRPVQAPDPRHVERLIADLGAGAYKVRTDAFRELQSLGGMVEPALQKAMKEAKAEIQQRLQDLIDNCDGPFLQPGEELGSARAVGVLGRIGTAKARAALRKLLDGAPTAALTRRAKAALDVATPGHGRPATMPSE